MDTWLSFQQPAVLSVESQFIFACDAAATAVVFLWIYSPPSTQHYHHVLLKRSRLASKLLPLYGHFLAFQVSSSLMQITLGAALKADLPTKTHKPSSRVSIHFLLAAMLCYLTAVWTVVLQCRRSQLLSNSLVGFSPSPFGPKFVTTSTNCDKMTTLLAEAEKVFPDISSRDPGNCDQNFNEPPPFSLLH